MYYRSPSVPCQSLRLSIPRAKAGRRSSRSVEYLSYDRGVDGAGRARLASFCFFSSNWRLTKPGDNLRKLIFEAENSSCSTRW